jgi:hypothetical protein
MRWRLPPNGSLGPSAVFVLAVAAKDPIEARLAGEVDPPISQHRYDLARRSGGELFRVTDIEYPLDLSFTECEAHLGMDRLRALVPGVISLFGPALVSANRDAKLRTGCAEARACAPRFVDERNCYEAI